MKRALKSPPRPSAPRVPARTGSSSQNWSSGIAVSAGGTCRYRLFKPPGARRSERLPLVVMLHGCQQDAEVLAFSTGMNRIAAQARFVVLYPEKDRLLHAHRCWNWYDARAGGAQRDALAIEAAIEHVCRTAPVDRAQIALAGLSAGAGMAGLLAVRHPERYRGVAMHSGVAPGVAHSSGSALRAMRGRGASPAPLAAEMRLPPLLVIHGTADHVVAASNGAETIRIWTAGTGAKPSAPRSVQRGLRRSATVVDHRAGGRVVATHCEVDGLGHAWSGGSPGYAHSDPRGPDAARMIWTFMRKQFSAARV